MHTWLSSHAISKHYEHLRSATVEEADLDPIQYKSDNSFISTSKSSFKMPLVPVPDAPFISSSASVIAASPLWDELKETPLNSNLAIWRNKKSGWNELGGNFLPSH